MTGEKERRGVEMTGEEWRGDDRRGVEKTGEKERRGLEMAGEERRGEEWRGEFK